MMTTKMTMLILNKHKQKNKYLKGDVTDKTGTLVAFQLRRQSDSPVGSLHCYTIRNGQTEQNNLENYSNVIDTPMKCGPVLSNTILVRMFGLTLYR